ncbi:hypothetical protein KEJ23_02625 [Candidatus Bathyarchaeota archaeon]|nr:hypothetical protein [Candidatus Bathyarchaeota archaeon]
MSHMFSKRIYQLSCTLLLISIISSLALPSRCETVELVTNGGFENGMNGWRGFSYCDKLPREGTTTNYRACSGVYSLYTLCGTGGEHCYGVGGGATQEIRLNQMSNLTLRFSVYPFGVPEENAWINIALIADFWISQSRKTIVYYVAWTENIAIYRDYPLPTMASENVKNILLSSIECDKWSKIVRNIDLDFKQTYPNIPVSSVERVAVTLLAVTFQRLASVPAGAFWDDVSITFNPSSKPEDSPKPIQTPTPTTSPTPTPEPTSTPASKTHNCIIVTVAYGSELAPEVYHMRQFRDDMIGSNNIGRLLVEGWNTFYYLWSPPIARFIAAYEISRKASQLLLLPLQGTVRLASYVYLISAPFSKEFASIVGFTFAAILSTASYILAPILMFRTLFLIIKGELFVDDRRAVKSEG